MADEKIGTALNIATQRKMIELDIAQEQRVAMAVSLDIGKLKAQYPKATADADIIVMSPNGQASRTKYGDRLDALREMLKNATTAIAFLAGELDKLPELEPEDI